MSRIRQWIDDYGNFREEEYEDVPYQMDEYDRDDFEEWEQWQEDMYNDIGWPA